MTIGQIIIVVLFSSIPLITSIALLRESQEEYGKSWKAPLAIMNLVIASLTAFFMITLAHKEIKEEYRLITEKDGIYKKVETK